MMVLTPKTSPTWMYVFGVRTGLQSNCQLDGGTVYSPLRPTRLDKIKNFPDQVHSNGVTSRLSDHTLRMQLPSPCSPGGGFSFGRSGTWVGMSPGFRL